MSRNPLNSLLSSNSSESDDLSAKNRLQASLQASFAMKKKNVTRINVYGPLMVRELKLQPKDTLTESFMLRESLTKSPPSRNCTKHCQKNQELMIIRDKLNKSPLS